MLHNLNKELHDSHIEQLLNYFVLKKKGQERNLFFGKIVVIFAIIIAAVGF